jgi:DNA helicase HerA-like ATPase
VYEQKGYTQDNPEGWSNDPPTFEDLLEVIKYPEEVIIQSHKQEYIRLLDTVTNSTMVAVENRLVPILEHPAFSGHNSIPIDEIVHRPLRIELKPLNTIDNQFLAADTIIRQIFAYLKSMGHIEDTEDSKFRLFIMIDEVKILTGIRGKLNDPYHILNRLATEARKFGLGLILASQILGHFGRDIRSNAASKVILRTMDLDETKRCAKEFKLKLEDLRDLSRPGEGFISTSRAPDAEHIQLFPSEVHPISKSD